MAHFYENLEDNQFGLLLNQYLLIKNENGEVVDKRKWNGNKHIVISHKKVDIDLLGKIAPINLEQELAFDMLQDKNIKVKVLSGGFGTGKDYIMIANALNMLKNNKISKIVWVRNNVEVKNTKPIGFLPGSYKEKLYSYAMILADHLGGTDGLDRLISEGKIELEHLGMIRGRQLENSVVYSTECENLTKEHVQLLLGRIGKGSELWMNGDYKQVDNEVFEYSNGLKYAKEKLKGNPLFGYVKLKKIERSAVAQLADILD
jgi:predicted ribonuclease YlaK